MKECQLLLLLALSCLLSQGLSLSLPGILSSFTRRADSEAESELEGELEESSEGAGKEDQSGKYPTTTTHRPTRPPLLPAIPHPADTSLNPLTNPNHPLHPDNLPSLLPLPQLPGFPPRETIIATKTVFVEVTDRLTIHPVCMTTYKVTPPCLPYDPHHHAAIKEDELKKLEIQAQAASVIKPTAVIELEPSRILDAVSISADADPVSESDAIPVLEAVDETPASREARYMELTPSIPSTPEKVEIKDAPAEPPSPAPSGGSPLDIVHNLLHNPVIHYKTKTLWVTKVEKILDTRVTATLVPKNCIPTNSHIPLCAPHGGLVGPGYHGYQGQGDGVYTESYGGHMVAGHVHTEHHLGGGYHSGLDIVDREQQAKESDLDNKTEE